MNDSTSSDSDIKAAGTADVAFIGLGVMGFPMAGHLASAGYRVAVFNRTANVAQRWQGEHSGSVAATPAAAAADADIVFMCVGADDDVRSVVYGDDGVLAEARPGSILVDHTTASADLARELASACAERDVGFIDAPVSGGEAGAQNGLLTVMCGGVPEHFERARPVMDSYARAVTRIGGPGAGQLTKMVNQRRRSNTFRPVCSPPGFPTARTAPPRCQKGCCPRDHPSEVVSESDTTSDQVRRCFDVLVEPPILETPPPGSSLAGFGLVAAQASARSCASAISPTVVLSACVTGDVTSMSRK